MGKKRVFELAKEMGYSNQDLIEKLRTFGFEVKSHSSTVDDDEVKRAFDKDAERRRTGTDEKRLSGTVIRRRAKGGGGPVIRRRPKAEPEPEAAPEVEAAPAPSPEPVAPVAEEVEAPVVEAAPEPVEVPAAEVPAAEVEAPVEAEAQPVAAPVEEPEPAPVAEAEAPAVEAAPEEEPEPAVAAVEAPEPVTETVEVTAEPAAPETPEVVPEEAIPAAKAAEPTPEPIEEVVAAAETSTEPVETPAPQEAVAEVAEASPAVAEEAAAVASSSAPGAAEAAEGADEDGDSSSRREARAARPDRKSREEQYEDEDEKPDLDLEDFGFSEADFAMRPQEEIGLRVAPPPPSTTVPNPKKDDVAKPRVIGKIDPEKLKARMNASKRPEPPKEWGRQKPEPTPGVTEKVMVRDGVGRGKLVDAREVAKNKKSGRPRREEMSAKELLEAKTKQVFYPTPSRKKPKGKKKSQSYREPVSTVAKQPVVIGDTITVAELSQQMSRKANELIMWLMRNGVMANINQPIDHDTATMLVEDMGYEVTSKVLDESELLLTGDFEAGEETEAQEQRGEPRAPVVTVMGHVDHGKTSLLDRIRNAKVAEGEAGGITQRIAGYQVETPKGVVTFLDTPGHAAFTSMRARGANITDIVVLVVAADDGVMPQTREAIRHAQAAGVPIIVAVNKVDKPEANPGRVMQQLTEFNIVVEEYGGDTLAQQISAKTGQGIPELLEHLALQAEVLELKAETDVPGVGSVVEGHIHKGRGPVATILVREGTLRKGDIVVIGESVGKVRAMIVDGGRQVKEAGPSTPVEILGLDAVPNPGEDVRVAKDMAAAKELAAHRREKRRAQELSGTAKVSLQDLFGRINGEEQKELKLILKGDVQGSVEALGQALTDLSTPKVKVAVISSGVGGVTESDVEFAAASEAIVIGFAVRPDTNALKSARSLGVDIRTYEIIYEAVDEVQAAMRGLLAPVAKEKYLGRAEVLQTFTVPKVGTVAGCKIVDGVMQRNANIRLLRDSKIIYDGKLASLRRFKDDVREVKEGFECGMGMEKFNDIKEGDIFEAYEIVMTEAALDEPTAQQETRA